MGDLSPQAASLKTRKLAQDMWQDVSTVQAALPRKSIMPPFTMQVIGLLQRLNGVITRLGEPEPPELYRVLSHADVVVIQSIGVALSAEWSAPSRHSLERIAAIGTDLLSDDEVSGDGPAAYYATTMRHVDWLRNSSPDMEERRTAETMKARFYLSLSDVEQFAQWVANANRIASQPGAELWANVGSSAMTLGQLMVAHAKAITEKRRQKAAETPLYVDGPPLAPAAVEPEPQATNGSADAPLFVGRVAIPI